MCKVIWYSFADGSWGSCECVDMLIVKASDLTADDWAMLDEAGETSDDYMVASVLTRVNERTSVATNG